MHTLFLQTSMDNQWFSKQICRWYKVNKRDLPFRRTSDPYIIWVSEIIFQQTRINQGLPYFESFISRFPDLKSLAMATEQDVLLQWQGLGYYSRARNLYQTAKLIFFELGGVFPKTYDDWLQLKGIGPYTAAAICSIAFNQSHAVVDGNVIRVVSRFYAIHDSNVESLKKKVYSYAKRLINLENPGEHNQALMEIGALVCTAQKPSCDKCPLNKRCLARKQKIQEQLPKLKSTVKKRRRYFYYAIVEDNNGVYISKREKSEIWRNLYEFPLVERSKSIHAKKIHTLLFNGLHVASSSASIISTHKHILSHQELHITFISYQLKNLIPGQKHSLIHVSWKKILEYPFPVPLKSKIMALLPLKIRGNSANF